MGTNKPYKTDRTCLHHAAAQRCVLSEATNWTLYSYHELLDYVREHGITQFLIIWEKVKSRANDELLWGDEIEYHLFCREGDRLVVSNRAATILDELVSEDEKLPESERKVTWHPEFGAWMVEATPSRPYAGFASDLRDVEPNMRYRRFRVQQALDRITARGGPKFGIVSMVSWPRLGTPEFWEPRAGPEVISPISQSIFFPDDCINPHPRFGTLVGNIRRRRGRKVNIKMPLLKDVNTKDLPTYTVRNPNLVGPDVQEDEIYMDAMGFGMGNCCLQVTFQARDIEESRYLYDQMAVLCPIFLALTAGTPILKGLLAGTDVRWSVIAQSVDCRTPAELGVSDEPVKLDGAELPQRSHGRIRKSRYDSVDLFMSNHPSFKPEYNDVNSEIDKPSFDRLVQAGVDERLASHVAHLFVRDPLVIFNERINVDDAETSEHFENLQSTNWQTMRWKPPPPNSSMGWRVEFRPMEVQFSDLENAAFTVVVMLCARVILFFDLSLYIPLSKVDENMKRAHERDAVLRSKFFFRKNVVPLQAQCASSVPSNGTGKLEDEYEEMTIAEILLGRGENFPGLFPLIQAYLDVIQIDPDARAVVNDYLDLVAQRARGDLPTPARWIREFVRKHPAYKHDSIVTDEIAKDLVEEVVAIGNGDKPCPELLGQHHVVPLSEPMDVDRFHMKLRTPGKALRGASFHSQLAETEDLTQCAVIKELLEKYSAQANKVPGPHQQSVLQEGRGFDQARPMFKRQKSGK